MNELAREKRVAAQQRAARAAYLGGLSEDAASILADAEAIYFPEGRELRNAAFVESRGVGHSDVCQPAGYRFREYGWADKVFDALQSFPSVHDFAAASLWPMRVNPRLVDRGERLESLPVFHVPFGWARHRLRELFDASQHGLALLTTSFDAGIVVSVVGGYLATDPNPLEKIYELGTWSRACDDHSREASTTTD